MPRPPFWTSATVFLFGIFIFPGAALAGFQWVAPVAPQSAPAASMPSDGAPMQFMAPAQPSSQSNNPVAITPLVIQGGQGAQSAAPAQPVGTEETPMYNGPIPSMHPSPLAAAPASNAAPAGPEPIVRGFAKSVPLAVALRQVLPEGYSFSVDAGVDMGTSISFEGGHPWRETLRTALQPVGLAMRETNHMVSIGFPSAVPAEAAPGPSVFVNPQPIAMTSAPSIGASNTMSSGQWAAQHGDSLRKILSDWCERAHVDLDWLSEYDYPVEASVDFNGTFEDAVRNLLTGFESAHPQPVAELHSNARMGQMVLVVQSRGNSSSN